MSRVMIHHMYVSCHNVSLRLVCSLSICTLKCNSYIFVNSTIFYKVEYERYIYIAIFITNYAIFDEPSLISVYVVDMRKITVKVFFSSLPHGFDLSF